MGTAAFVLEEIYYSHQDFQTQYLPGSFIGPGGPQAKYIHTEGRVEFHAKGLAARHIAESLPCANAGKGISRIADKTPFHPAVHKE